MEEESSCYLLSQMHWFRFVQFHMKSPQTWKQGCQAIAYPVCEVLGFLLIELDDSLERTENNLKSFAGAENNNLGKVES